jgi:hypothetical protein
MTPAIFGITNGTINAIVSLLVLSLLAMWVALIYWSFKDAERRIEDPVLMRAFPLWSVFPFVGTVIYSIIRPPEYLEDAREREVETKSAEARLAMLQNRTCRNCGYEVEPSYLRCPSCLRKLKEPCESCGRPLDPRWRICPFCESEVQRAAPPAPARRRRAGRTAERTKAPERPAARPAVPAATASTAAERQRRSLASVKTAGPESQNSDSDSGARETTEAAEAAKPVRETKPMREAKPDEQPPEERLSAAAAIGPPSPGSAPEAPDAALAEDRDGAEPSKAPAASSAKRSSAKRSTSSAKKPPSSARESRKK